MFNKQEIYSKDATKSATASGAILLIEDQPIFGMIMKRIITEHTSYQVIHLNEGTHIIPILSEYKPQLMLLDYDLPGMNGIEIYDLVHNIQEWAKLPTIMISASLPEQEIRERRLPGLNKPCSPGDLLKMIKQVLN